MIDTVRILGYDPPTIYKRCAGRKAKQMSKLKKDIREEILDILRWPYNKRPVRLTQSEALRQQRATDILNLIESVIPEEIDVKSKYETDDDGGIIVVVDENNDTMTGENLVHLARLASDEGYNQAIKDIKSKLIGKE